MVGQQAPAHTLQHPGSSSKGAVPATARHGHCPRPALEQTNCAQLAPTSSGARCVAALARAGHWSGRLHCCHVLHVERGVYRRAARLMQLTSIVTDLNVQFASTCGLAQATTVPQTEHPQHACALAYLAKLCIRRSGNSNSISSIFQLLQHRAPPVSHAFCCEAVSSQG